MNRIEWHMQNLSGLLEILQQFIPVFASSKFHPNIFFQCIYIHYTKYLFFQGSIKKIIIIYLISYKQQFLNGIQLNIMKMTEFIKLLIKLAISNIFN